MKKPYYYRSELQIKTTEIKSCDLCVYGGTSAGVTAAVEGVKQGLSVVLLVNGEHIGGLTTGGLGFTDYGKKSAIGGLAREFYQSIGSHYGIEEEWFFEPSVARKIMDEMLRKSGVVPVSQQFLNRVEVEENRITSIEMESGLIVKASQFIDATYEGDLLAKAGVRYTVGREGNEVYGEFSNGVQLREHHQFEFPVSPWKVKGDPKSGLLPGISSEPLAQVGTGDHRVQAYNFRMCLSRSENRIPFEKPADYNPENYELLARYLRGGWRDIFSKFDATRGGKTDTNNHGAVSTDFIGQNYDYPEASYQKREEIFQAHVSYTKGLFWFYSHDERVPVEVQRAMQCWGLCSEEFEATGHWPAQLYIREARRMVSDYVMTELNCRNYRHVEDSIGCGAYGMDSHNCQRVVVGDRVLNEGDIQAWCGVSPYGISYRSVIPKKGSIENIFVPVCLSASHIAYGSIRMEPVFMILGQSCAIAAKLCIANKTSSQDLPYGQLKQALLDRQQVLELPPAGDPQDLFFNSLPKQEF